MAMLQARWIKGPEQTSAAHLPPRSVPFCCPEPTCVTAADPPQTLLSRAPTWDSTENSRPVPDAKQELEEEKAAAVPHPVPQHVGQGDKRKLPLCHCLTMQGLQFLLIIRVAGPGHSSVCNPTRCQKTLKLWKASLDFLF